MASDTGATHYISQHLFAGYFPRVNKPLDKMTCHIRVRCSSALPRVPDTASRRRIRLRSWIIPPCIRYITDWEREWDKPSWPFLVGENGSMRRKDSGLETDGTEYNRISCGLVITIYSRQNVMATVAPCVIMSLWISPGDRTHINIRKVCEQHCRDSTSAKLKNGHRSIFVATQDT
jgi:hypothetical protein